MTEEQAKTMLSEDDKRIVIVTGAGGGMGREIALAFARLGDHVVIVDNNGENAAATADLVADTGLSSTVRVADVSSREDVSRLAEETLNEHGRVDVLCNNAAVRDGRADAMTLDPDTWDRVLAVNLTGPFLLTHALLPSMIERGSGVILNVSSVCGIAGGRSGAAYTTSKHALIGLSKNIAFAFAETGVRCNAICPGAIDTNPDTSGVVGVPSDTSTENPRFRLATSHRPGGRRPPREMGDLAVFLASDAASFINGQAIVADGGWLAA